MVFMDFYFSIMKIGCISFFKEKSCLTLLKLNAVIIFLNSTSKQRYIVSSVIKRKTN